MQYLSPKPLNTIKNISKDIEKLSLTDSVVSILNVPLLQNTKGENSLDKIKTLSDPNVNKKLAKQEFITSGLYKQNLISKNLKTSTIVIKLKHPSWENSKILKYLLKDMGVSRHFM